MARQFARLRRSPASEFPGAAEVPDGGVCLSAFLVLEPPGREGHVLAGQIDPDAPWWEIGALDPRRIRDVGDRWMLPSSQLLLFEPLEEASRRILREQLGSPGVPLTGPFAYSDPAAHAKPPATDPHWDLHFVYRGRWPTDRPPVAPAWKRLEFVDVAQTPRASFARGQGDVLELVGLRPPA